MASMTFTRVNNANGSLVVRCDIIKAFTRLMSSANGIQIFRLSDFTTLVTMTMRLSMLFHSTFYG